MSILSDDDIAARMRLDNPWWEGAPSPILPPGTRERFYFGEFYHLVAKSPVRRAVVLMGPRRAGKTVMLHQAVERLLADGIDPKQILYVSLDTPHYSGVWLDRLMTLAAERHGLDVSREAFVFYDEVQYFPDWERHLKSLVDTYRQVRFAVSGSAAAALKLKSRESGAGRFTDILLPPLSFAEYVRFVADPDEFFTPAPGRSLPDFTGDIEAFNRLFVDYIHQGGFPEGLFSPDIIQARQRFVRQDIIDKVLNKDIPSLYGISDTQELNKLFTYLAGRTGQEVSLEGLSNDSGLAANTIRKYVEYLEAAFLIGISRRVDQSAKRFKKEHGFKVYLTNTTLHTALFGPAAPDSPLFGHLVETALANQVLHIPGNALHYSRWKNREVDVVLFAPNSYELEVALEVKWSDRHLDRPGELDALMRFCKANKLDIANVSTRTRSEIVRRDDITVVNWPCAVCCYRLALIAAAFRNEPVGLAFAAQ